MKSLIVGLMKHPAGLDQPQRLAIFLGELAHESGFFSYDQEIWGPTPAQKRYDTRTDLGNTKAADGDGYALRGRGPIQITGGYNYEAFTAWCRKIDPSCPDFRKQPDLVLTDPWEGLSAIWFWERNKINDVADTGNIDKVTRIINGGTNGASERIVNTVRVGLALLGKTDVASFQRGISGMKVDGVAGPVTRAAMHKALKALPSVIFMV
jgi:putative chitinase